MEYFPPENFFDTPCIQSKVENKAAKYSMLIGRVLKLNFKFHSKNAAMPPLTSPNSTE